jgi:hypothetical protein
MGRNHILSILHDLNIPNDKYVVTMGAVLSVNNLRPASDIDIIFDESIETTLVEKGFVYEPKSDEPIYRKRYVAGPIEAFSVFYNIGTLSDCLKKYTCELVEGVPFMSLDDTLSVKKLFSRPKDMRDMSLA